MAFDRNYDALLARAAELGQYDSGYLDSEDKKAFYEAQGQYRRERDQTVYDILSEKPDLELVLQRVREDLGAIAEESPDWAEVCKFVADDLVEKLREESSKSPFRRSVVRYAGVGFFVMLGAGYFGAWLYNDLTVDQGLETKAGLIQHAAAYDKARNYDDMAEGRSRRGGFLKGILLKPWEPDEQEITAATDFIGLTFEGLAMLSGEGAACYTETLLTAPELTDAHLELVDSVSEYVQGDDTQWLDPPAATIVPALLGRYGCAEVPIEE